jgi:hypothetical protein
MTFKIIELFSHFYFRYFSKSVFGSYKIKHNQNLSLLEGVYDQ